MEPKKKQRSPAVSEDCENTLYDRSLCSATDCTGLIPALPVTDSELDSYEALYHFLPKAKKEE